MLKKIPFTQKYSFVKSVYVGMRVQVSVNVCVCAHVIMWAYICESVNIVFLCVHGGCAWLHVWIYACDCVSMHMCVYMFVHVSIHEYMCFCVCDFVCMHVCECVCIYVIVCSHACMCMWDNVCLCSMFWYSCFLITTRRIHTDQNCVYQTSRSTLPKFHLPTLVTSGR